MFRIVLYCDDRKLADVLRTVAGLVIGSPEVVPMVNAEKKQGKLVAITNGSKIEMFGQFLKQKKILTDINATIAREACRAIGMSPASSNYLLKNAVKQGLLKKHGKGSNTKYEVA